MIPIGYDGGTNNVRGLNRPHWKRNAKRCVPQSSGIWSRHATRGNSYENSPGVHLRFINAHVSSSRSYNRQASLDYHNLSHQVLCGSNANPVHASQVMQLPKR